MWSASENQQLNAGNYCDRRCDKARDRMEFSSRQYSTTHQQPAVIEIISAVATMFVFS